VGGWGGGGGESGLAREDVLAVEFLVIYYCSTLCFICIM
jgi:hypothetical protein